MKIALPTAGGQLCMHFGHCEKFVIMDVDDTTKAIISSIEAVPPPHEPGVLPKWLYEHKVNTIIAGGMGMRAQQFFKEYNIQVVVGAAGGEPKALVNDWFNGTLTVGTNVCDH